MEKANQPQGVPRELGLGTVKWSMLSKPLKQIDKSKFVLMTMCSFKASFPYPPRAQTGPKSRCFCSEITAKGLRRTFRELVTGGKREAHIFSLLPDCNIQHILSSCLLVISHSTCNSQIDKNQVFSCHKRCSGSFKYHLDLVLWNLLCCQNLYIHTQSCMGAHIQTHTFSVD